MAVWNPAPEQAERRRLTKLSNGKTWRGVYPALTTQFGRDGSLELKATAAHLGELIREDIHGVIVLGTVGEGTSLQPAEKLEVL